MLDFERIKEISEQISKLVDKMGDTADEFMKALEKFVPVSSILSCDNMKTAVYNDVFMFMLYLATADGNIGLEEAKILSGICKEDASPDMLITFAENNNAYLAEYKQRVPATFHVMVDADKICNGLGVKRDSSYSEVMISMYKAIGDVLIVIDGEKSEKETSAYNTFIHKLEEFCESEHINVYNTVKTTESSDSEPLPPQNGVAAPKKG